MLDPDYKEIEGKKCSDQSSAVTMISLYVCVCSDYHKLMIWKPYCKRCIVSAGNLLKRMKCLDSIWVPSLKVLQILSSPQKFLTTIWTMMYHLYLMCQISIFLFFQKMLESTE